MQIIVNKEHRMNVLMDEILVQYPHLRGDLIDTEGTYHNPKIKAIKRDGVGIITINDENVNIDDIVNSHDPKALSKTEIKIKAKNDAKEECKKIIFKDDADLLSALSEAFPDKKQKEFLERLSKQIMNLQKAVLED